MGIYIASAEDISNFESLILIGLQFYKQFICLNQDKISHHYDEEKGEFSIFGHFGWCLETVCLQSSRGYFMAICQLCFHYFLARNLKGNV